MSTSALGKEYQSGEMIIRQGETGDCMYVIQEGKVEIYMEENGRETSLRLCREGDFLGELALFNREKHSASARSAGTSRILTVDKKNFMRRIKEDPTIAFRLVEKLSTRVKELSEEVAVLNRVIQECLEDQLSRLDLKAPDAASE